MPISTFSQVIGALILGTMLLLAGCDSSSSDDPPPPEPPGAQVAVSQNDSLGSYLTDEDGNSLYLFTDGEGNPVPCTSESCLEAWPPFLTDGEPGADDGANASLLSTTDGPNGGTQVVYNGWPLWYFAFDENPGDVNGQGIESFGGIWYLVSPAGEKVQAGSGNDDDGDGGPY